MSDTRHIAHAFYGSPWAIQQAKLREIEGVIRSRFYVQAGDKRPRRIKPKPAAARGDEKPYLMSGSVAILRVFGTVSHRMNMFSEFSGGTSTELLARRLDQAIADPDVASIMLDVDSPGGSVFGVPEMAAKLFEARKNKRIVAVSNDLMASAAYWIGSAATEIVMTPSGQVGSIGVYVLHEDVSAAADKAGVKVTPIYAGKYKVDGHPFEPLTESARADLQGEVDWYYTQFVNAVARHRGTTPEAVRNGYGEGRALTADAALAAKLVDRVATFEAVLKEEVNKAAVTSNFGFAKARQAQLEAELDIAG